MRLLLTGGGTLGSVTPLLALHEVLIPPLRVRGGRRRAELAQAPDKGELRAYWLGTYRGVERELIAKAGIPFFPIAAGKLRRYFDVRTLFAPFVTLFGFLQSLFLLLRFRPDAVIGAGGYVQVPVVWAAWCLRIPSYTMQLDVRVGLTSRLTAPFVRKIFCAFAETAKYFPREKTVVTGVPVRQKLTTYPDFIEDPRQGRDNSQLTTHNLPMLLVLGGGTGSLHLNEIVIQSLPELTKFCRVVHITGKNKMSNVKCQMSNVYQHFDLLTDELFHYYSEADLVLTRAGMGVLSELAALAKAAIVVPYPESAQMTNVDFLMRHNAAIIFPQEVLTPEFLTVTVKALLHDPERRRILGEKLHTCIPTDGADVIAQYFHENMKT